MAYYQTTLSGSRTERPTTRQVSFPVAGLPPARSEALSIFGAGHPHAPRVRSLLHAAQEASAGQGFTPAGHEAVALELTVHRAQEDRLSDATNFLGGVGDVLKDKRYRRPLLHLDDLAAVWLYRNDRQIKQVLYREDVAARTSYTVTVRVLD